MASGQTPQYLLNQWVKSDQVLMEEFNADNLKLDTALAGLAAQTAAKAEASALTALETVVGTKAAASDLTTLAGKVAAKAEQSALDSLSAQVATKAASSTLTSLSARVPRITIGSYTGDGMAARTISLGFTPQAVFVCQSNGAVYIAAGTSYHFGGLAFTDNPVKADNSTTSVVAIVTGGFQVTYKSESYTKIMSNTSDKVYYYVAVDYPG